MLALMLAGLVAALLFVRQRRHPIPLPPFLTFLLENPLTEAVVGAETLIDHLNLAPGMRVLDAGCGPGRLTIPVSEKVGPAGEVVALDTQEAMLERLRRRLARTNVGNVRPVLGQLGTGDLCESAAYDRVILAMTLGEIRERDRALREIYAALKSGGLLSITEVIGDPDYRSRTTVRREAEAAGFVFVRLYDGYVSFTMNFVKPAS